MTNTKDQMQDVFPIDFNFVNGEQPDANKLTGWRKQTDSAFNRIVSAIGDPWEYNVHISELSPERLLQASLARIIGPSSYLSPDGAGWNEASGTAITVKLQGGRNTWDLGFPLVKKNTETGSDALSSSSIVSSIFEEIALTSTNFSDIEGIFVGTPKADPSDVSEKGDYYIDYFKGIITSFSPTSKSVTLTIPAEQAMVMVGPGVPWGTHNVIPDWNDDKRGCTITAVSTTRWTVELPLVGKQTVTSPVNAYALARSPYSGSGTTLTWGSSIPGEGARYRLPETICALANLSGGGVGTDIPDGFMYLWDDETNRILPLITFQYKDEYSVTAIGPENMLTVDSNKYRLITTGTSISEAVKYLMTSIRYNKHNGLNTLNDRVTGSFSPSIHHSSLAGLYTGPIDTENFNVEKYRFAESKMPINPHPQYLHRAGFDGSDSNNTNNAMRGNLVLTGQWDGTTYPVNDDVSTISGCLTKTYALTFGGKTSNSSVAEGNPGFRFEGGENIAVTAGPSNRLGFGLSATGMFTPNTIEKYGALSIYQYYGMPLYLKGKVESDAIYTCYNSGGSIAFNYDMKNEMNYIKLVAGYRPLSESYDAVNKAATNDNDPTNMTVVEHRFSYKQVREFRFRAISYNPDSTETGLESSGEFSKYFTSPSIVGADWLNVYSNAIFFSEVGNGRSTSFTKWGKEWLENHDSKPVGIYYIPMSASAGFQFITANPEDSSERGTALQLSKQNGSIITSTDVTIQAKSTSDILQSYILVGSGSILLETSNTFGSKNININAASTVYLRGKYYEDSTIEGNIAVSNSIMLTTTDASLGDIKIESSKDFLVNVPDSRYFTTTLGINSFFTVVGNGNILLSTLAGNGYVQLESDYGLIKIVGESASVSGVTYGTLISSTRNIVLQPDNNNTGDESVYMLNIPDLPVGFEIVITPDTPYLGHYRVLLIDYATGKIFTAPVHTS